jgi:hypothetical protein
MQFSDYTAFRVAFMQLADGDDVSQASFSPITADLIITLGEDRVYRDLRASTMVEPLSVAVASNAAALPADLIELKEVYFSGERPLEVVDLDRLRRYEADGYGGLPSRFVAQDGDTLRFWPEASGTVLGSYYAKPDPLKTITWANATTFARYPEVFLFAALAESVPFLTPTGDWEAKYARALAYATQNEQMRVYGGSPLRMRAR